LKLEFGNSRLMQVNMTVWLRNHVTFFCTWQGTLKKVKENINLLSFHDSITRKKKLMGRDLKLEPMWNSNRIRLINTINGKEAILWWTLRYEWKPRFWTELRIVSLCRNSIYLLVIIRMSTLLADIIWY
jgi:hypothetical protein